MVLANVKIFPFAYVSHDIYARFQGKLLEVEERTNSEITFNFEDQFFNVKARSQEICDKVESLLSNRLFPSLNGLIDFKNYLDGVIPPLHDGTTNENTETRKKTPSTTPGTLPEGGNEPHLGDASSEDAGATSSEDDDDDDDDSDPSDDSFVRSLPTGSRKKGKSVAKAEKKDAKSALMKKKKNEFQEKFMLAKNIKNPDDILLGPPMLSMAAADHLVVVGQQTDTECVLNGREVHIFGPTAEAVKEAKQRFMAIQSLYKRCRREPTVAPCLHLNGDKGDYGVYLCPLDQYSKQDSVATFSRDTPSWVLVPVYKKPNGQYMKPSNLVSDDDLADRMNELSTRFNRASPVHSPSQTPPKVPSPSPSPSPSASSWGPSPSTPPAWGSSSPAQTQYNLPERTSAPPGQEPLWGENRYTVNVSSPHTNKTKKPQGNSRPSIPGSSWGPPPSSPQEEPKEFPALPTRPTKEPSRGGGKQQRRVLTIRPQKAPQRAAGPSVSRLTIARDYNLNNMKEALREGLDSIRTFRGEIKLSAKLGKILWRSVPENVQKKIWEMFDIKDVVMKEHKVRPTFNNMAIVSQDILNNFMGCLPDNASSRSTFYEVHSTFRTKVNEPWKQAAMYIAAASAKMYQVHLMQQTITEVDWISLDRKFDFQMQLKVSEVGRPAVKPFVSFSRRMALRPNLNGAPGSQLVYEETPGLVKVDRIYHKDSRTYSLGNGFDLHVTQVEEVPCIRDYESPSYAKYIAQKGTGRVWYEVEVTFQQFQNMFKANMDKEVVGTPEEWTPEDVFGKNDALLQRFVVTMINTINRCEQC